MKDKNTRIRRAIIITLIFIIMGMCGLCLRAKAISEAERQEQIATLKNRNLEIEKIQESTHNLANMFRAYGLDAKSDRLLQMSATWRDFEVDKQNNMRKIAELNNTPVYTQTELDLMARVIYCEAGSNEIEDEHQQLVGQVIMNRVASSAWPNTITDVIYAKGQYACVNGKFWDDPVPQRCYDNAVAVLEGKVDCPGNVVYQANIKLGNGVYKTFKTSYSTTYFCYGKIK